MATRSFDIAVGSRALWPPFHAEMTEEPDAIDAADPRQVEAFIIERALAGDSEAFDAIVVRYQRRVVSLSWRLLGDGDAARDAAQEVFLRAFRYLHRYDRTRPIEGWLAGIAVNVCRDLGGQRRRAATPVELDRPKPASDPHADLALAERRRMLNHALTGLLERERVALVLRDLEGFSTAETAGMLGVTETAVRALIGRARVKIRVTISRMEGRPRP